MSSPTSSRRPRACSTTTEPSPARRARARATPGEPLGWPDGPLCVGDLVAILRAPQPTVSRHLAYLRRSGFVETRQHGPWMFYELAPAQTALHSKLLESLGVCAGLLPTVKADVVLARSVRRSGGCCPDGRRLMGQSLLGGVDE